MAREGWKSKQWYNIVAPDMLGKVSVGETIADDPEKLLGRVVEITLGDIVGDFSKQNIKLNLKIEQVGGDTAYTKFVGHQLTQDYLRSLVRRQTSLVSSVIEAKTSDGRVIRVKPVCFTIKRARQRQIKAIRQAMEQIVKERAGELNFDQFVQEVVGGKLAATIYRGLKSIYPPRRVEIRKTEVAS